MKYNTILFDFDGTLCNTYEGIAYTFMKVLTQYGVDYSNVDFNDHIGPPLEYSFRHLVGDDKWEEAVAVYRKTFVEDKAHFMCHLYDGVVEMLSQLVDSGLTLCVATSKYEPFAVEAIERLGIAPYITHVYGQTSTRGYKDEIIASLISENNIDVTKCLMVGDTTFDVDGAKRNNMDVLAVSYGFDTIEVLEKSGCNAIVDSTAKVTEYILGK